MLLVNEIFLLNNLSALLPHHFPPILRRLFDKAINDKQFLKQEAKNAIASMEQNDEALFEHNLAGLNELCFDKNVHICELACQSLHNIVMKNKHNLTSLTDTTFSPLIHTLSKCLQGKRAFLKKLAKEMCSEIYTLKGDAAFSSLSQHDVSLIIKAITIPKNESKPSFRDFLALKKKEQIWSLPFVYTKKASQNNHSPQLSPYVLHILIYILSIRLFQDL